MKNYVHEKRFGNKRTCQDQDLFIVDTLSVTNPTKSLFVSRSISIFVKYLFFYDMTKKNNDGKSFSKHGHKDKLCGYHNIYRIKCL